MKNVWKGEWASNRKRTKVSLARLWHLSARWPRYGESQNFWESAPRKYEVGHIMWMMTCGTEEALRPWMCAVISDKACNFLISPLRHYSLWLASQLRLYIMIMDQSNYAESLPKSENDLFFFQCFSYVLWDTFCFWDIRPNIHAAQPHRAKRSF